MNTVLWIAQVLLALAFAASGLRQSVFFERTRASSAVAAHYPRSVVTLIGACELLGAAGVVLPWLTGVLPWLTPLAAACLVLVMALAAAFNVRYAAGGVRLASNAVLGALAAFVAYGRVALG
jgi:hypothetical protein